MSSMTGLALTSLAGGLMSFTIGYSAIRTIVDVRDASKVAGKVDAPSMPPAPPAMPPPPPRPPMPPNAPPLGRRLDEKHASSSRFAFTADEHAVLAHAASKMRSR